MESVSLKKNSVTFMPFIEFESRYSTQYTFTIKNVAPDLQNLESLDLSSTFSLLTECRP